MKTKVPVIRVILPVILLSLLAACASPMAVIRMNPESEQLNWNYGQAYAADTVAGIIVEAAFDKATKEHHVFDVAVVNGSNLDFLVDPSGFYIEDVTNANEQITSIKAIDPEIMLLNIDKQLSKDEANSKNAAVGMAVAAGALVAASVAVAVIDDNQHHYHRSPDPDLMLAAPIIIGAAADDEVVSYASPLEQQRELWERATIRKTTLKPGYKIEGKVYFPRFENPGRYVLKLPVDDQLVEITFVQLNFMPDK